MDLSDIDLLSRDIFVERVPHEWFEYLRNNNPIYRHPEPDGPGFGSSLATRTCRSSTATGSISRRISSAVGLSGSSSCRPSNKPFRIR